MGCSHCLTRIVESWEVCFSSVTFTCTHGVLSVLPLSLPKEECNATNTCIHKCNFIFCTLEQNTWDSHVNIQGIPFHTPCRKWDVFSECISYFFALSPSMPLHAVSSPCRISTSLPWRKFVTLSAHI